jgi:hypothetical protein
MTDTTQSTQSPDILDQVKTIAEDTAASARTSVMRMFWTRLALAG